MVVVRWIFSCQSLGGRCYVDGIVDDTNLMFGQPTRLRGTC